MKAVLQWVLRTMMKDQTGIVKTMPKKDLVDFNVAMTMERLMRNGIDPNSLKNANQVENAINQIEAPRNVQQGIKSTKSAKVFDLEGKEIKNPKNIMGGKAIDDDPPPSGIGKNFDDMLKEVQTLKKLEKGNKEGIARIRARQKMLDDAIDNQSPSLSGDTRTDAVLVAEDLAERMGLVYDDLPIREQTKLYDQAYQGLSKMRFESRQTPKGAPPKMTSKKDADSQESSYDDGPADFDPDADNETFAQGGRAGFDNGGAPSLKLFPRASGIQSEQEVGPGIKVSERDLNYGITGLLQGNNIFGGAEIDKGKVKIDVISPEGDTLFKDTIRKKDAVNFILGMGDPTGEKFQIKTDKDFNNMQLIFKKKFNEGGIARLGLKEGSGMTRRTFLKLLGGMAAIPIVGKFLKPIKTAKGVKAVPIIKTDNVPGKPEWFDALVNKVIVEGDDVTKKFATGERQSIHQKTLDDGSVVRVTEDVDDGAVRVEYESDKNVFEDPVQLQYKKPLPDEGDPRPTAEFTTAESGPVGRRYGPDDYEIEVDEVGGTSIRDLDSDVSKLKEYATGKKPTMTEIVQNKKRRDKAKAITEDPEAQSDAVIRRQGEAQDSDYETLGTGDDFASGGIARMLGE